MDLALISIKRNFNPRLAVNVTRIVPTTSLYRQIRIRRPKTRGIPCKHVALATLMTARTINFCQESSDAVTTERKSHYEAKRGSKAPTHCNGRRVRRRARTANNYFPTRVKKQHTDTYRARRATLALQSPRIKRETNNAIKSNNTFTQNRHNSRCTTLEHVSL